MLFTDSPLMRIVERVIKNGYTGAFAAYGMTIHVPGEDIETYRMLKNETMADFVGNYRPEIVVQAAIPEGKYSNKLIPNQTQLEVSIYRKQYNPFDAFGTTGEVTIGRFHAILLNAEDGPMVQHGTSNVGEATQDLGAITMVKLQLFSEMTEQFRNRSSGGTFRRQKVADVIRFMLLGESQMLDLHAEEEVAGFEMVEPPDSSVREVINIAQGIQSSDVPGYIHKHCGGVYAAGFSYYCHLDTWYVYPTYDFTRFNETKHQLTIVIAPSRALPMIEFTCMKANKALTVICTGEVRTHNISNRAELESGNGVRFTDPVKLLGDSLVVKGNKAIASRGAANNELVSKQRANGMNNVRLSDNPITSNRLYELSKLAMRRGQIVELQWENSQADLLVPGMQIKAMFMQNDLVNQRWGVLLGYKEDTTYTGQGLTAGRYMSVCTLFVFIENETMQ